MLLVGQGILINAIPNHWKFFITSPMVSDPQIPKYELIKNMKKISRFIYHDLIQTDEVIRTRIFSWYDKYGIKSNITKFRKHFKNVHSLTQIIKLKDFQYRLLHNKIFCNDVLVHWGKVPSNICEYCTHKHMHVIKSDLF